MSKKWENVTVKHVHNAIALFDSEEEEYPPAKNTFLIYNGREYPAKHIRWIAYRLAHKKEISKEEFSGGKETADFFIKLGFTVKYRGKVL